VNVGQVPVALVEVEPIAHEKLIRNSEADVANGKVIDQASIGAVK